MFISAQERVINKAIDIFEALDLGVKNVHYFIDLCNEVAPEVDIFLPIHLLPFFNNINYRYDCE